MYVCIDRGIAKERKTIKEGKKNSLNRYFIWMATERKNVKMKEIGDNVVKACKG